MLGLGGCTGVQSVLDPAGTDAEVLAHLFWILVSGAVVLWILLNGTFFYVSRMRIRPVSHKIGEAVIIGAGIAFPTVLLAVLLSYGLSIMPDQRAPGDGLTVRVTGEQWWWRVEYLPADGSAPVVSANELRLPVGARTEIKLGAAKVIHSFWVPNLAGKMDMFPGRETRMAVEPTRTGEFRGQCAEFCGTSHALMAFPVVVLPPQEFEAWLAKERADAAEPADAAAARGREVFLAEGCGACHAVRGTPARGRLGPDLTHVGGRRTIGAGTLPASAEAFGQWLARTDHIKPDVRMPTYRDLPEQDLLDLATYLKGLR
ncbi:cytochrome c oxidase subunit II [Thalassobaculum sp.]|uniref:cytochrome c oxidase subunit II n=1 Tax=Thalassobaculum sp. TaxID=2022740 RepID=UPI003B5990D1